MPARRNAHLPKGSSEPDSVGNDDRDWLKAVLESVCFLAGSQSPGRGDCGSPSISKAVIPAKRSKERAQPGPSSFGLDAAIHLLPGASRPELLGPGSPRWRAAAGMTNDGIKVSNGSNFAIAEVGFRATHRCRLRALCRRNDRTVQASSAFSSRGASLIASAKAASPSLVIEIVPSSSRRKPAISSRSTAC